MPFESLEPRWKVLELDGQSPVRRDFDPAKYPLQVTYGLEAGELPSEMRQELEAAEGMRLPLTNRRDDRLTTVVMTGVTALTRATAWEMDRTGVTLPARDIGDWLRQADVTHISHEVAFTPDCPPPSPNLTVLIFCAQPGHIALLEDVGTDVIELTGNHVLDAGKEALRYSLDLYRANGWQWFGGGGDLAEARQPVLIEHNGNRIAFVGCNEAGPPGAWATPDQPGANPCGRDRLAAQVSALRDEGYLPIFTFQWHEHYTPRPPASQREAFRAAAEAGAVAVSGSQAHQPQGFAFADGAFIHYGLGNLFFDQMWSEAVRQEFIDRYVFHNGRLISVELLTAHLEDSVASAADDPAGARRLPSGDVHRQRVVRDFNRARSVLENCRAPGIPTCTCAYGAAAGAGVSRPSGSLGMTRVRGTSLNVIPRPALSEVEGRAEESPERASWRNGRRGRVPGG